MNLVTIMSNSHHNNTYEPGGGGGDTPMAQSVPVDLYCVVLSAAGLVLSILLGGGGSLTVLLALFRSPRVAKYSYTLILVFFFLALALDVVWAPLELVHLLTFHLTGRHPTSDLGVATFALYIFLLGGLALLVTAFCVENVLRLMNSFPPALRQPWPLIVVSSSLLLALAIALSVVCSSLNLSAGSRPRHSYLVLDPAASRARIAGLTILLVLVVAGAVAVVTVGVLAVRRGTVLLKTSESFLSGQSHNSSSGGRGQSNQLPAYLTQQQEHSGPGCSSDDCDQASASPSSSKIPDIMEPEVKVLTPTGNGSSGGGGLRLQAMPPPPASKGPSMLGVNMAQVLGRRRHTICQIGDSSTPPDPLTKAKQYNYVRKFSVDISALQAQLENPKLFKEIPFQSDQDLAQRQKQEEKKKPKPEMKPLQPLPNFGPPRLDIAAGGGGGCVGGVGGEIAPLSVGLKLNLPSRPPVITVSEEVKEEETIEEEEEEEEVNELSAHHRVPNCMGGGGGVGQPQYTPIVNKEELTDIPKLPVEQPVDEDEEDQREDEQQERGRLRPPCPHEDDDSSFHSASNDTNNKRLNDSDTDFLKMTLLLTFTFFVCSFPLFLVEVMKASLHAHTYVNISTCARALSAIQTIIFPHVVMCMDSVVHRAVARLKVSASTACALRDTDCMELSHEHPSSTASQV